MRTKQVGNSSFVTHEALRLLPLWMAVIEVVTCSSSYVTLAEAKRIDQSICFLKPYPPSQLQNKISFDANSPLFSEKMALTDTITNGDCTNTNGNPYTPTIMSETTNRPSKSQRIQSSNPWRYQAPKKSTWDIKKSRALTFQVTEKERTQSSIVLRKKSNETLEHCLCKALLWALFVEDFGPKNIGVEWDIGDKYLPDVIAFSPPSNNKEKDKHYEEGYDDELDQMKYHQPPRKISFETNSLDPNNPVAEHQPLFWGESGRMSPTKAADLSRRFPHTHLVHMRWGMEGGVEHEFVQKQLKKVKPTLSDRTAPFHVVTVNGDPRQFLDEDGNISVSKSDFVWMELKVN